MNLVEQMFGFLEPSYIPNGLLFPAALPLERTYEYNGRQLPHDGRRLTPKRFGNLLFTLQSAQRDPSNPALFDNDYVEHYRQTAASETVYLGGVLAAGGNVQNDALANGWILVSSDSSALYDSPTSGPHTYRTDTVFAFAPLVERFAGTSITYQFDPAYFYGNQAWPAQLEFDPGDGFGFRAVGFGDSLSVDYSGLDTVRMEMRFAVGSQNMRAYAMGIVPPAARMSGEGFPICFTTESDVPGVPGVSIEFQPADEECEESWFANSLIVVDGIDPGNSLMGGSQAVDFGGAYRKYSQYEIAPDITVADEIIAKGYDFVFINFDDGGQSVQSTAQILKAAIHWINAQKAERGNAGDNIVIGHSMGGLTSKWALSEMARDKEDHGVSKFFSFDSPLRGATIPLGLQAMLQYLINFQIGTPAGNVRLGDTPAFAQADEALNCDAARELLIYSVTAEPWIRIENEPCPWGLPGCFEEYTHTGQIFDVDFEPHIQFQEKFDNLHPLDVPHIAIADGNRGFDQLTGTTDGGMRISSNGGILDFVLRDFSCADTMQVYPACDPNQHARFTTSIKTNYWPGGITAISSLAFLGSPFGDNPVAEAVTPLVSYTNLDAGLPRYDLAPACHADDGMQELVQAQVDTPNQYVNVDLFNDHFAFVPTSSALNLPIVLTAPVGGCGPGIADCITPENMLLNNRQFVEPTGNHEHVTFTPQIATQLLERIPDLTNTGSFGSGSTPSSITSPYNFSAGCDLTTCESAPQILFGERTVTSTGKILVNDPGLIRYQQAGSDPTSDVDHFDLYLKNGACDNVPADITLQSGARFIVGKDNDHTATVTSLAGSRVTVQNGAAIEINDKSEFIVRSKGLADDQNGGIVVNSGGVLHAKSPSWSNEVGGRVIVDGGTIRIKAGGQLRTSFNSQIIARNGGKIILEDGALVQLWSGSDPEGDGTIWIQEGGELVIDGEYTYTGSGYWQFDKGNTVSGDGDLVIEGEGKEFRRMRLNKSAQVILENGQGFEVTDAKVEYDYGSSVQVLNGSAFDIGRSSFVGPAATAILTDGSARSSISTSEFIENKRGVKVNQDGPLSALTISSSLFQSSTIAGVTFTGFSSDNFGRTPSVSGCTFAGCEIGVHVDGFLAANISTSTFTSSEEEQFAINAHDCTSLNVNECSVVGYETYISNSTLEGAVELEFVTARFSGGEYSTNTVAIHDQAGSTLTFNKCVDIVSNCYGIATSEIVGQITTLALDGMSLLNNSIGIHGGSGIITSGGINSFQMPESSSCDFAATPRLISMDVNQMAAPSINLNGNHWLDSQGGTLTVPPVQSDWFCIVNGPNNWCTTSNIPTDNLQLEGCASGPCEDPKTCDYYCQLYPESLPCYSGGGGVFKGFTATPNPSGGIVALSHLPENGGTLHVFDSRGSLVKTYQLEASTHQVIDFYNLHSGIYNLQLIDREKNDPVFVRLVLSK